MTAWQLPGTAQEYTQRHQRADCLRCVFLLCLLYYHSHALLGWAHTSIPCSLQHCRSDSQSLASCRSNWLHHSLT